MQYVALFRGINVGGKNIVKMADLRELFCNMGFANVQTYIQSGNVVFSAAANVTAGKIQAGFLQTFGFESAVTLRTLDEIMAIWNGLPFSKKELQEAEAASSGVEHLYVYFFEQEPDEKALEKMKTGIDGPDKLCTTKREAYLLCHGGIRNSQLAARLAKIIPLPTARNWKTLAKLLSLMSGR